MRKTIVLLLISLLSGTLLLTSCVTPEIYTDPIISTENGDSQDLDIVTITGKVEILSDGTLALVEKWESKSRISYTVVVVGDESELLALRDGDIVTVECIVTMESPWKGKIAVISVHP
ncbi:MAG: hypothetical protein H8D65_01505 [Spirochaetes bacterium]|nr:hypothetical protein [Spirochaetota bacterium]MBL7006419.1 hypothetical protein [Spirochaetia bacterium]